MFTGIIEATKGIVDAVEHAMAMSARASTW